MSMTYPLIAFIRMQRSAFKKSCIRLNTTRLCCNPGTCELHTFMRCFCFAISCTALMSV